MHLLINRSEKVLINLLVASFFLILLVPLIYSQDFYYPYVTVRNFFFRIIVEIQFVIWFLLILKNRDLIPKFYAPFICFFIFIFLIFIANVLGIDPSISFWGNLERMDGMVNLLHFLAFSIVAASVLKEEKIWARLSLFSQAIALVVGALSLKELVNDPHALISSTLGNSAFLAVYMAFHVLLAGLMFVQTYQEKKKISYLFLTLLFFFLFVLYNTGGRGSLLGLGIATVIAMAFYFKLNYQKKWFWIPLILLVLVASGIWGIRDFEIVKKSHTLSRIVDIKVTSSVRFKLWELAANGIKERPILGWGQENFDHVFDRFYVSSLGDDEPWFDRSHNAVLDWFLAGGLLGGLAYLSILVSSLYCICNKRAVEFSRLKKSILLGMLALYFVHNLFMFDSLVTYLILFFIFSYISIDKRSVKNSDKQHRLTKLKYLATTLLSGVLAGFMIYNLVKINPDGVKISYGITEALQLNQKGMPKSSFDKIKNISAIRSFASREASDELGVIAYTNYINDIVDKKMAREDFDYAYKVLKQKSYAECRTVRKSYVFLNMAGIINDSELEHIFSDILALSPKRQVSYQVMIKNNLKLNKLENAMKIAKTNFENDPTVHMARSIYALTALLNNKPGLSDELMGNVALRESDEIELFLDAYETLNNPEQLISFYKKLIFLRPNNIDYHTKLGMYYQGLNREAEANAEFNIAKEMTQKKLSGSGAN